MNKIYIITIVIGVLLLIGLIILIIYLLRKRETKKLVKGINDLEIRKNQISSKPVLVELAKIEEIAKSEQLEERISDFKVRYQMLKERSIPKITDEILVLEEYVASRNKKAYYDQYSNIEIMLYEVESSMNKILEEIDEIASYEEKYRDIVIKLKAKFRSLERTFNEKANDYGDFQDKVRMQIENIERRFNDFDTVMEEKLYNEVVLVVNSLDTMINHLNIIIQELPGIVLLLDDLIPGRIKDLKAEYKKMVKEEYALGYLDFENNMNNIKNRENDIISRAKVLNINDSLFDLKVILEYLDGLFKDLELEKQARKEFDLNNQAFNDKTKKLENAIKDIYEQMDDIKKIYSLKESDLEVIDEVNISLSAVIKDYKKLIREVKKNETSYVKLNIDLNNLLIRFNSISNEFDSSIKSLGSMYDDEVRSREELNNMQDLLIKCKRKVRNYHLPIVHENYFVEESEARDAINEAFSELNNKPIVIKNLHMRLDTARELVFKLNNTTNNMVKYAYFTELLVVYGNKYRTTNEMDKGLSKVEILYSKGEYEESYHQVLKLLEPIKKGITKKVDKIINE